MTSVRSVFTATGSYIPPVRVPNDDFLSHDFWDARGARIGKTNREILEQFEAITGIRERRTAPRAVCAPDVVGGATLATRDGDDRGGILANVSRSDTLDHSGMLSMGPSYKEEVFIEALFLKMEGRKLYKYALQNVAGAMKQCLDQAGLTVTAVTKILLPQAHGEMDGAILCAFYGLYGVAEPPADVAPVAISLLRNSSGANSPH